MKFYLGTHHPNWLWDGQTGDVPLFVSHRRLMKRKTAFPRAAVLWALDSGGFTELSMPPHRWVTTPTQYLEAIERYAAELGQLAWAAPMDWMCEPWIVEATGLSVREHQERTVANFLELDGRAVVPVIPVLQGWTIEDYERCINLYADAGVDLFSRSVVGLGSVCRRQSTSEIGSVVKFLSEAGLRLHGFGVKKAGVQLYGEHLVSSDSMAWSYDARRAAPLPGCTHLNCANCAKWALRWRRQLLVPDVLVPKPTLVRGWVAIG